jgi:DtxR family transcriptional regulator, Mn-dependent transcriptional regulator
MMHRAEEDYLKCIYKIITEEEKDIVKANEVSEAIGNTIQTVNEMVKRLDDKGFLVYIPYKGVKLTEKGIANAQRLIRHHRLWEVFLVEKLGYSWTEVHEEAEKLEHASSNKLMDRMNAFLDEPKYCVHGNAIPQIDKETSKMINSPLPSFKIKDVVIIKRVIDQQKLLLYLDQEGIVLNKQFTIIENDHFNEIIKLKGEDEIKSISFTIANKIYAVLAKDSKKLL